jgi:hypothetical protein
VQCVVNGRHETFVVGWAGVAGNTGCLACKCKRPNRKEKESIPEKSGEKRVAQNRGTSNVKLAGVSTVNVASVDLFDRWLFDRKATWTSGLWHDSDLDQLRSR